MRTAARPPLLVALPAAVVVPLVRMAGRARTAGPADCSTTNDAEIGDERPPGAGGA